MMTEGLHVKGKKKKKKKEKRQVGGGTQRGRGKNYLWSERKISQNIKKSKKKRGGTRGEESQSNHTETHRSTEKRKAKKVSLE